MVEYLEWYNAERLHSTMEMLSPIDYELARPAARETT